MSLIEWWPDCRMVLFCDSLSTEFKTWCINIRGLQLRTTLQTDKIGWSIKPYVILKLLEEGHQQVLWIDSDILVNGPVQKLIEGCDTDCLIVTEEALAGNMRDDRNAFRARGWGFEIDRYLNGVVNTCFLRVSQIHRPLIQRWADCMKLDIFLSAQSVKFSERLTHLAGDQDVLTALLCSRDFSDVNVTYLKRGRDIIQFYGPYGFTVRERYAAAVSGLPPLIHSQASKPWIDQTTDSKNLRELVIKYLHDVSPYKLVVRRKYDREISQNWSYPQTIIGKILNRIFRGSPIYTGMPLSLCTDIGRLVIKMRTLIISRLRLKER